METLRVTLVQSSQFWEDKRANFAHFDAHFTQIGETDLVLLPEMFHTGFTMNVKPLAEEYNESSALLWLKNKAITHQTAIYTSFICRENDLFFNRGVFVYPNGETVIYDKRKLFTLAKEDENYTAGTAEKIVLYKGFKFLLSICYDLRFPEILRNKMLNPTEAKYDVLLNVANWPERRSLHWKSLLIARAIENQCFLVGVNRVGTDENGLTYSGYSVAYTPLGQNLSNITPSIEQIETVILEKSTLLEIRQKLNFLDDI